MMIGVGGKPSLLVFRGKDVEGGFVIRVVNGGWDGVFVYTSSETVGYITMGKDHPPTGEVHILCTDEKRLRGDYQDVFDNYEDPTYVGPEPIPLPACWDDDIAF